MFELFHNLTLSNKKNLRSKPFAGENKKAHNHLGYLGGFKVNEPKMSSELIYFKHKEDGWWDNKFLPPGGISEFSGLYLVNYIMLIHSNFPMDWGFLGGFKQCF